MNNLIFVLHSFFIAIMTILAIKLGKQYIISLLTLYGILANLFVLKQITLLGLQVTSSDVFVVGISLGLNLLQEKYGKQASQSVIYVSFLGLFAYTILGQFQIWYLPNELDATNEYFLNLLTLAPRLTVASLASYLISQTIDINLYAYLKSKLTPKFYFLQNYSSIAISQLADTIIFSFLGLYGLGYNLWHIIIFSYLIKLAAITISVLTVASIRKFIKI